MFLSFFLGPGLLEDVLQYGADLDRQAAAVTARAPVPTPPANGWETPSKSPPLSFNPYDSVRPNKQERDSSVCVVK